MVLTKPTAARLEWGGELKRARGLPRGSSGAGGEGVATLTSRLWPPVIPVSRPSLSRAPPEMRKWQASKMTAREPDCGALQHLRHLRAKGCTDRAKASSNSCSPIVHVLTSPMVASTYEPFDVSCLWRHAPAAGAGASSRSQTRKLRVVVF